MTDLSTSYLGLELENPIVASAGPVTGDLDRLVRAVAAGASAVVLPSLFEEDVVGAAMDRQRVFSQGTEVFAEATTYLPEPDAPDELDAHLQLVSDAKARVDVPVIASLNGRTPGGWLRYASELVAAGADALELNLYVVAADPHETGAQVEARMLDLVRAVRREVTVPLAVKLSPYVSALGNLARELTGAGADGLVLFNRFYQPDLDLETLEVQPSLTLSSSAEVRLPLRWIALLRDGIAGSLAASTGVHTAEDVVKLVLVGADAVMTTSALLQHGPEHVATLRDGLRAWLEEHEYASVAQAHASARASAVRDPDAFERAHYVRVLRSFDR